MAKSVNSVIISGRLTKDIDVRSTTTGKKVGKFTLAVDKNGKEDGAHFVDVTIWEKGAELVETYTHKGSKVLVQGSLNQETWEKDGQKNSKLSVVASDVTFLDSKPSGSEASATDINDKPVDLSEIPF